MVTATKAGYEAASEVSRTLDVDLVRPALETATVASTTLKLSYSEVLDPSSTPGC